MLPRWSLRYGAYEEEEDWDLKSLSVINSQLKMYIGRLPGGPGDLTLAELQEMATRQQQQMEAQQQVLVAKEQRLKYLKQQEARHAQLASESERLRKIRERVESQELKLKKLRALRGQAEQYRTSNGQLNSELDAVKAVFNEKEKELAMAVARVDQLTRQLKDLRNGNANTGLSGQKHAAAAQELEKLRKELLLRNKLNEQQTNNIAAKEKLLQQKQDEVKNMDNRILELQQRLKRRKLQEDQNRQAHRNAANKQNKENVNQGNMMKSGDPYIQYAPDDITKDDSYSQAGGHFTKHDPKYKTLPNGVRMTHPSAEVKGPRPHQLDTSDTKEGQGDYNLPVVLPIGSNQTKPCYNLNTSQQQQHCHRQPQDLIPHPGKPQKFNNNDFSKPNQNFTNLPQATPSSAPSSQSTSSPSSTTAPQPPPPSHPQPPVPAQRQQTQRPMDQPGTVTHPSTTSSNNKLPNTPRMSSTSSTGNHREGGMKLPPSSLHPIISIHEEERQAGSGQSSPASSEGSSNSSGGIRIKDDESTINQTPVGPVSAMIQMLNKGKPGTQPNKEEGKPPSSLPSNFHTFNDQNAPQAKSTLEGISSFIGNNNNNKQQQQHQQHPYFRMMSGQGSASTDSSNLSYNGQQQEDRNSPRSVSNSGSAGASYPNQVSSFKPSNVPTPSQQANTPQLNVKPAPTYKYASKNQIANMYMGRLGGAAMEKYQHNLNKLYKNMDAQHIKAGPSSHSDSTPASGAGTGGQEGRDGENSFGSVSPHDYPDIASDKGSYKLNTPKQVRRRHSDGESEEVNKALQDRQDLEAREQQQAQEASKVPKGKEKSNAEKPKSENEKQKAAAATSQSKSLEPPSSAPTTTTASSSSSTATVAPSSTSSESKSTTEPPDSSSSIPSGKKKSKAEEVIRRKKSNLKKEGSKRRSNNRVSFDPLALLLDGSLEGELDLVKKVAVQVDDVSTPNDEGITALHNAICAGHYQIVKFLIEFGCDVNSPDSDGWTPLHCAASCNNLPMVRFLVEHGACVFATTISDQETAADKCEEDEDGYDGCSDYLYSVQEKLGISNSGDVYAVFDYSASNKDELGFVINDKLMVLRKGDETEKEWWWARLNGKEGYIPRNLLGLYPRVLQQEAEVSEC